jgi:UPF0755 protein
MSELGLSFDEPADWGRHRHRRGAPPMPRRPRRRRGRTFMTFMLVVALLGGLGYAAWWGIGWVQGSLSAADYSGEGTGSVTVEVEPGQTAAQIAVALHEADVVASREAFVAAATANPQSVNIQPGVYELRLQMSAASAMEWLLDLNNRVVDQVLIQEGLSMFRTFEVLSEALDVPVEEFEEAAEDPVALGVPEFWFNRTDDRDSAESVEGFLFPSTYEFPPEATAAEVLEIMVGQFLTVAEDLGFVDAVESELDISPYEALIVASLAQAEAGIEEDIPKVARVAYNRVYRAGMPLQFDVTANYWLEVQGEDPQHSGQLTDAELNDPNSPYNTGDRLGWPLGPINSPGQAALEAAMEPADGDWLFFVAIDETGRSAFAVTDAEHEANKQEACANGIPLC